MRTLRNLYIWTALCAILGWAHVLLNRPFRWLPWANEAVYPWYVLHQSLIVLFAYWLLPLQLGRRCWNRCWCWRHDRRLLGCCTSS